MAVRNVLSVDKNEAFQSQLSRLFEKQYPSITLVQAYDSKQAMAVIRDGKAMPDLMFLDLELPGVTGPEFLKMCQAKLEAYGVKVVVLASANEGMDRAKTKQFSFIEDYLPKAQLQKNISKYIEDDNGPKRSQELSRET